MNVPNDNFINEWMNMPWVRLAHIRRYSTQPVLHQESVAEHSFFVSLYAYALVNRLATDGRMTAESTYRLMRLVLLQAIVHDVDESLTGDFIRPFKYSTPEITSAIKNGTRKIMDALPIPREMFNAWASATDETLAGQIVKLADLWSVVMYARRELKLGNQYGGELIWGVSVVLKEPDWNPVLQPYVQQILNYADHGESAQRKESLDNVSGETTKG